MLEAVCNLAGLVNNAAVYNHSSAINYAGGKGLLDVMFI
jgi:hypothetical protein